MGTLVVVGLLVLTVAAILAFIGCSAAVVAELWGGDDPAWAQGNRLRRLNHHPPH